MMKMLPEYYRSRLNVHGSAFVFKVPVLGSEFEVHGSMNGTLNGELHVNDRW